MPVNGVPQRESAPHSSLQAQAPGCRCAVRQDWRCLCIRLDLGVRRDDHADRDRNQPDDRAVVSPPYQISELQNLRSGLAVTSIISWTWRPTWCCSGYWRAVWSGGD